jgi:hypothetical protein
MYVNGAPVWAEIVEDGVVHRVHKDCKKYENDYATAYAKDDVKLALCTTGCNRTPGDGNGN